jgi:hypothetical protein
MRKGVVRPGSSAVMATRWACTVTTPTTGMPSAGGGPPGGLPHAASRQADARAAVKVKPKVRGGRMVNLLKTTGGLLR